MLRALTAGPGATVQDLGRPAAAPLGVPPGGACDPVSLVIANHLLGNEAGAAALEVTFGGLEMAVLDTIVVAIAGADLGAVVEAEGRRLAPGLSHVLWAGSTISFRGAPAGRRTGARAYLGVPGGFDVPMVLGSAATCLVGRFGGLDGRAVQPGDRLRPRHRLDPGMAGRRWPGPTTTDRALDGSGSPIRLIAGPDTERFDVDAVAALTGTDWRVLAESDRMGLRLGGPPLQRHGTDAVSRPMTWGALQVPADGAPICLLADHQTIGGYPVVAVAARADRGRLGQLAAGDDVRFATISIEAAETAHRELAAAIRQARAQLDRDDEWIRRWQSIGG